jgi:murein DD-endopeptidase MepM/ murein hydrolase activator NlpD
MTKASGFKNWLQKATRIVGMDPKTFQQSWVIRVSRIQIISSFILIILIFLGLFYVLFSYTPLSSLLPAGSSNSNRTEIAKAYEKMEKLDNMVIQQTTYIENLQNIILGKLDIDSVYSETTKLVVQTMDDMDTSFSIDQLKLEEEVNSRAINQTSANRTDIRSDIFLLDPVSGEISQNFHAKNHPGVDVIAPKNTPILAVYRGNVVHAGYDEKDGYTLVINHPNGLTTIYKHCDKLLKQSGETVSAGDPIGIVGNSGERTSGPHLHFELWSATGPLNPMDYFSFGR